MTHDELNELIPLLAIDALADAERDELRQHIAACASCADLLSDYEAVGTALLQDVPSVDVPPELELALRGRVRALRRASLTPRVAARPTRKWQQPFALPHWAALGAAAALVLMLVVTAWAVVSDQLNQASVARSAEDLAIAKLLETPGTVSVNIKGTDNAPAAMGQVILNSDSATAYLIVNNLAPVSGDQTYQVWLVRDGQRDNAGTFSVDNKGHATARIWASKPWNTYQEIGVTLEPAKGSQWPTTPRLVGGYLR